MNAFDQTLITWTNQLARRSELFDSLVSTLVSLNMAKGGLFVVLIASLWIVKRGDSRRTREVIVATAAAAIVAIVLGRLLATGLPFRLRPMHNPQLGFVVPYGADDQFPRTWSAFPSDHAMLFAALATGVWFVSPLLGLAAHVYAALFIMLPRLYVGLHHPTDLLAGALIGVLIAAAANRPAVRTRLARGPLRFAEARPAVAFVVAAFLALQVATMFEDSRVLLKSVHQVTSSFRHRLPDRAEAAERRVSEGGQAQSHL